MPHILVPIERLPRWLENFEKRHGRYQLAGSLVATADDGATATIGGPFGLPVPAIPYAAPDIPWGVLLVRRGGFAVAAGTTRQPTHTKVGRRHVQGKTKAGGWSQQRFARRRENQARDAFEAAADHAHRILVMERQIEVLVCGGDRKAVDAVLGDRRLEGLVDKVTPPWLAVPDPTRAVLDRAVVDAWSCVVEVVEPHL